MSSPVVLPTERLGETAVVATGSKATIQTADTTACRVEIRTQDDAPSEAACSHTGGKDETRKVLKR